MDAFQVIVIVLLSVLIGAILWVMHWGVRKVKPLLDGAAKIVTPNGLDLSGIKGPPPMQLVTWAGAQLIPSILPSIGQAIVNAIARADAGAATGGARFPPIEVMTGIHGVGVPLITQAASTPPRPVLVVQDPPLRE